MPNATRDAGTELNILYACDENYAPYAGVSMTSLFMNNQAIDKLVVYFVLDQVSEKNRRRYQELAAQYHREVILLDAAALVEKIKALGIPSYRGSYTTNFRLFFNEFIRPDVKKLLYLDCDTLILGSLLPLAALDMQGKPAAMVLDSMSGYYKRYIGFAPAEDYYNAGVTLLDVPVWNRLHCSEQMLQHIIEVQARYCNPDQDLLNVVLKEQIYLLPQQYNVQVTHRAYTNAEYFFAYPPEGYYTPEQLDYGREHAVILHSYRFLGQFPWHTKNLHPDTPLFDSYLEKSLWSDYQKKPAKLGPLFRVEHMVFKLLPHRWFLKIFATLQLHFLKRKLRSLEKGIETPNE